MNDKPIPFFKRFVIQNFPFIEEDFDALTNYQLFCKVVEYLNKVIGSQNEVTQQMEYVLNYFNNLDVQEEINNKLDQMAESGELTDLIAGYLNLRGILAYNTVAEMKAADNLVDGSFAETYGFYAKGDTGGAKYKIRAVTNADTVDEMTLIALSDESLVAELMLEDTMNVRQFGAKGDSETDDTAKIQKSLDFCENIIIPDGTYMINAVTSLLPNSNNHIEINENAILKAITNSETHYAVIKIDNKSNVIIKGGTIEGERSTHTGDTGEWGHCVTIINGSTNISLSNMILKDGWGDGLYIYGASNVRTTGLTIDNARRNGISIISVNGYKSLNDTIKNTNGTAPECGIDIEPNNTSNVLRDIVIENLHTNNNTNRGVAMVIENALEEPVSISLVNHYDYQSLSGLSIAKLSSVKGFINIESPIYERSSQNGIFLRRCCDGECAVRINKPTILYCNNSNTSSVVYSTPIVIANQSTDADTQLGNIEIIGAYVKNVGSSARFIYVLNEQSDSSSVNNIRVVNPIYTNGANFVNINAPVIDNVTIIDDYKLLKLSGGTTFSLLANQYYSELDFVGSQNRTWTLPASIKVGFQTKFVNMSSYNLTLTLTDQTCTQLGVTTGGSIKLTHIGDAITLKKISSTDWIVIDKNCEPTIA